MDIYNQHHKEQTMKDQDINEQDINEQDIKDRTISIGVVSTSTGIPISTLRTWERRYGFPTSERSNGGQRLYNFDIIRHLRLINDALKQGFRPKQVMLLPLEELQNLVGSSIEHPVWEGMTEINEWLEYTKNLDGESLDAGFQSCFSHLGLLKFMTDRLVPFLEIMGKSWSEGSLEIYQEHFASQRILDFLTHRWRALSDRIKGNAKSVICAALPQEQHYLGLHMAATVASLYGFKVIFLGPKTPELDIQACAIQANAQAVLLSVSITTSKDTVLSQLSYLRKILPSQIDLIVGGNGSPLNISEKGVLVIQNLHELAMWCQHN